jgi:diguanylate cyclase (GGDEF)-like protein/PAS domain S-box-containing protein
LGESTGTFEAGILAALGQAVIVADLERRIIYWNAAAEEMFGWSAEEVLGRDVVNFTRAEEEPARDHEVWRVVSSGQTITSDYWMVRNDESRFPALATLSPLFENGRLTAIACITVDITDRYEAEEVLRRLSLVVESSVDAIVGSDIDGRITSWNAGAERLYGYSAAEAMGESMAMVVPDSSSEQYLEAVATWRDGELMELQDFAVRCRDGEIITVNVTVAPIRDASGEVIGSASIARDVTARKRLELEAEADRRRLVEAQEIAQLGSFEVDPDGTIAWSDSYRKLIGAPPDEVATIDGFLARIPPQDLADAKQGIRDAYRRGDGTFSGTYRLVMPDGDTKWVRIRTRGIFDESGRVGKVIGTGIDITERHLSEVALRDAEERFRTGFDRGSVATAIMDLDGVMTSVNPVMCSFLGRSESEILGHLAAEFAHPDDQDPPERDRVLRTDQAPFERRFWRPDGQTVWGIVNVALVRADDGAPSYLYAQVQDITERKVAEQALEHMALHDPLTGLPNRVLLQDRLEGAMARASRYGRRIAVIFGDVDRFKLVNDTLGHSAGDQLLIELARRFEHVTLVSDTVGRFGGNQFVMICEDVGELESAEAIGRRLSSVFDRPFWIGAQDLYVTVSCGIVLPGPGDTASSIFRDGDAAVNRAKELGRGRTELFDKDLLQRAARLLDLESALRHAVASQQLRLAYQPMVDLVSGRTVAVEALLRWRHPAKGEIKPSEFIPVAEQSDLIHQIGRYVIEESVEQIQQWRRDLEGAAGLWVSINLSAEQLSDDLVILCQKLADEGAAISSFGFEITESVLMSDIETAISVLLRLREMQIPVGIDDFGTGYSSLEYLKRLPVHSLKIDQSFTAGLGRTGDANDPSIVEAVIALGKALGMKACAEGVEREEQRRALEAIGCETGQGYLWSVPLSPGDFEMWFTSHHKRPAK